MTRARVLFLVLSTFLSACAPVMLGRTPIPAAPGVREMSVSGGYPVGLTKRLPDAEGIGNTNPAYAPLPLPLGFRIAYGRNETLETNVELMIFFGPEGSVDTGYSSPNIGARYGVKNRFQKAPVELAFDFGGSLYLTNVGVDAGILASRPIGETKLYGGLRGFGTLGIAEGNNFGGAVALTAGSEVPLAEGRSVMLELTFLTNLYNGALYWTPFNDPCPPEPQPVGFTLVPAITFNF